MGVNSLPKTVIRQRRDCDLNPGPSAPESSTLTTRLPIHAKRQTAQHQLNEGTNPGHEVDISSAVDDQQCDIVTAGTSCRMQSREPALPNHNAATENARPENAGLKNDGQLRKESQGLENAGLENDGPC